MYLTPDGLELIKHFEGLHLTAYKDPVGIWTIGYGHTRTAKPGMKVTEAEAEALLLDDLATAERGVKRRVTVPLGPSQYSALVSFTFNVGVGNLASSTLLRKLNAGEYGDAAEEFMKWRYAGGKILPGLIRRRASERHLFLFGEFDPYPYDSRTVVQKFSDGLQLFIGGLY